MTTARGHAGASSSVRGFCTIGELLAEYEIERRRSGYLDQHCAPWRVNRQTLVLKLFDGARWIYEVDLERCRSSAEVLDWICQVADKGWATDAVLAGLVRGLDLILEPQAHLCSWGVASEIDDIAAFLRGQLAAMG